MATSVASDDRQGGNDNDDARTMTLDRRLTSVSMDWLVDRVELVCGRSTDVARAGA